MFCTPPGFLALIKHEADKNEPVRVSLLVLLETEWVLRSRYEFPKPEILSTFSSLLAVADLVFADEPSVEHASAHGKTQTPTLQTA
jgi:hypothetical protein